MALSDFLADGSQLPAGSGVKSMTSQTVLPEWYTNYAMQLLANQNAVAARPYTTYEGPRVADFTPQQQQGFNMTGQAANAYQPSLNAAVAGTQGAMAQPGALATAQPYLNQAGQTSVNNLGQYMNPYTDQVVDRIGQMAGRNLSENIMPQIEGRYIQAGQLGYGGNATGTPSGMMTDTARAVRDVSADTLAQQTAALQQGYTQATGLQQTDLQRMGQLGATAGNFAGQDVNQQLAGAGQMAELGGMAQKYGLTGAEAVTGVGAQQQQLNQQNQDVAYADFLRQQGYPQAQIDAALQTLGGVLPAVPKAVLEQGITPQNQTPGLTTALGGLSGIAGVLSDLGVFS